MKFFHDHIVLVVLLVTGLLVPSQAHAIISVPEPVSLSLLAIGLGGLGAAELIRRRRDKNDK